MRAGNYSEIINGSSLTSGAYFISLEADDYSITEKINTGEIKFDY